MGVTFIAPYPISSCAHGARGTARDDGDDVTNVSFVCR